MAFSLKNILTTDLFHKKGRPDSVVGVDIGASSIKVVQLKSRGPRAVLETYGTIALGPYMKTDIGEATNAGVSELVTALTDVLREAGVTTKAAAFSMPSSASLIFVLDLPAVIEEKELVTVVPTQARKYIPVPMSEVALDWQIIPKKEELFEDTSSPAKNPTNPRMQVLLVAVHNEVIAKYKDIIKQSLLESNVFEVETFSIIRGSLGRGAETSLLIDFGASKTKLAIVERGIVRHFHVINRGSRDMTTSLATSLSIAFLEAEAVKREFGLYGNPADAKTGELMRESIDFLIAEIGTTLMQYERKFGKKISGIVCAGGGALLKGIDVYLNESLKLPTTLATPFDHAEAPAFLEPVLKKAGPEYAIATGLALRALENE